MHRLIYYMTIPLYVLSGAMIAGLIAIIVKLRNPNVVNNENKNVEPFSEDNVGDQELEKKRKKRKNESNLNLTVEELEPQETVHSSGSNYQDYSVSKMTFE